MQRMQLQSMACDNVCILYSSTAIESDLALVDDAERAYAGRLNGAAAVCWVKLLVPGEVAAGDITLQDSTSVNTERAQHQAALHGIPA